MRILIFNPFNDRSEVAMYLGLARAGADVELVCDPTAKEKEPLRQGGVTVTELPVKHRLDLTAIRRLRRILKARTPDVIYTTLNSCISVALFASLGLKSKHVCYRGTIGHISRWDPACRLTYLNPRISRIVCVSEAVRRYLLSLHLPAARLTTLYKGHDPAWYADLIAPDLSTFGIPKDAFVIGFTGRMRPVKGVDILIKAFQRLPANHNFHLLLVGSVTDPTITQLAGDPAVKDRIHFAGHRADAAAIAGACRVFVMPSLSREGLPRSVIEAMAQGVPPIVTDVGGMPELVLHNQCGLVVPPADPDALAGAITLLADNPNTAHDFGTAARTRIATAFNIAATVTQTRDLFMEVSDTAM